MPLVFVHGVNVRRGATPEAQQLFERQNDERDELFRSIGLAGLVAPPHRLQITNPYWGDRGATFTHDLVSVPKAGNEFFGAADDEMAQVLVQTVPIEVIRQTQETEGADTSILLTLARQGSLEQAVDAVVAAAAVRGDAEGASSHELAAFAAQALSYAASHPDLAWLTAVDPATGDARLQDDNAFLEALARQVAELHSETAHVELFGIGGVLNRLKHAAGALAHVGRSAATALVAAAAGGAAAVALVAAPDAALRVVRPEATRRAGVFLGDVFKYLADPQPIVDIVAGALDSASAQRTADDSKLVVVAHSMGGNIVYDILTHFRPELRVDLLLTVGSQVALFKELGLYREDSAGPDGAPRAALVPKPAAVHSWINVFDPLDVLGFAVEGVFADTTDYAFSNQATPLNAHSLYFARPAFHRRLNARIAELGMFQPL